MTQDEINEMVKQVGFHGMLSIGVVMDAKQLESFAKLVAERERERLTDAAMKAAEKAVDVAIALEREACAEIAEAQRYAMYVSLTSYPPQNGTAVGIANQIRARGQ